MPKKKTTPEPQQSMDAQPLTGAEAVLEAAPEGPDTSADNAAVENEQDLTSADQPEMPEGGDLPPIIPPPDDLPEILSVEVGVPENAEDLVVPDEDDFGPIRREAAEKEESAPEWPENAIEASDGFGLPELTVPVQERPDSPAVPLIPSDEPPVQETAESAAERVSGEAPERETDDTAKTPQRARKRKAAGAGAGADEKPAPVRNADERQAFYDLDFRTLDRNLTPEQRQEWNSIYASYRGRSVLSGEIVGVDKLAIRVRERHTGEMVRQEMYCAVVIPYRVRILIPSSEMWIKGEERPDFVLRNMSGAFIDFVVIHVDRESGFAIASRRLAMGTRRYYFSTQPALNRPGARVKCRVLAVAPRRCLVECNGFDISLTQREMRYAAIPDLRTEYQKGQELDCIVKEYDRRGSTLMVSVKETEPNPFDGAEMRHPVESRRQAVIAGKYAGGVFCNLTDGVVVMCNYSFHYEDSEFAIGERVMVMIQRYDFEKKQIYGKIVAKW